MCWPWRRNGSALQEDRAGLLPYGRRERAVREWLIGLDPGNRRAIGLDLQRIQYRWPIGMPLVRPLSKGLFEARTDLPDRSIARVLFCFHEGELYALHGFIKKSRQAPPLDLKLARQRKSEVENG